MDHRIQIKDNDYPQPYERHKRKFTNRPIPNSLRKCIEEMIKLEYSKRATP